MTGPADVLEGGTGPSWWRSVWTALSPAGRRLVVGGTVLVLLGAAVVGVRNWTAERDARRAVHLTTALRVVSSSTSPPGGAVRYFVRIRNDGVRPVSVTAVDGGSAGLRLRMQDQGDRRVAPGAQVDLPVSVRLSCGARTAAPRGGLPVEVGVRREDGGTTTRREDLQPAALLLDVARTLCAVRPDLRDHELSGPVLRPG